MKISSKLRDIIKKRVLEQLRSPESREVIVRTPFKLDESELDLMKEQFPALHDVRLMNEVDDSLIGGIVIVDGSMILDYSVKAKIENVVDTLLD